VEWTIFGQQLWFGLERGAVYVLFAMGLTLCFGVMGIVNFAHGELVMLGAMGVYSLMTFAGLPFFPAVVLCILGVAVVGIILNRIAIQPLLLKEGQGAWSVLLSTLAISWILIHGGYAIWGPNTQILDFPFKQGLNLGGVSIKATGIALLVAAVIAVTALYFFLFKTKIGKIMRATSQNSIGAKLVGINVNMAYYYTMVVAAALAAIAGIFLMPVVVAYAGMGQGILVMGFAVVIVGGMGNVTGCVYVGLLMGLLEALFGQYVSPLYRSVFIYGIMILVLLIKPEGLFARR